MKVLYADGTASTWKYLGEMRAPQDWYGNDFMGTVRAPNKTLDGIILSLPHDASFDLDFFTAFGQDCYGDCSYPVIHYPVVAWSINNNNKSYSFKLSGECDASVTDGCAGTIGFYTTDTQSDNEFMLYEEGFPLSYAELQKSTNALVW